MNYNVLNYPEKDINRFWSKVNLVYNTDKTVDFNSCMDWNAGQFTDGYGQFWFNGQNIRSHRFIYECFNGRIDNNSLICHTCNNPLCVNPFHLFAAKAKDNSLDMVNKNRQAKGDNNGMTKLKTKELLQIINDINSGIYTDLSQVTKKYNITNTRLKRILYEGRADLNLSKEELKNIKSKILTLSRPGSKNGNSKITEDVVLQIRKLLPNYTNIELAKTFNVSRTTISNIRIGKSWSHV